MGEAYSLCVSPFYYTDLVRESHHRYKFQGASWHSSVYAGFVAQCVAERYGNHFDLITWVPLSKRRLRTRGYDQAKLLAVDTAAKLGTEAIPTLKKVKNTSAQSSLGGSEERRANIAGAYAVLENAPVSGKCILLVDDIVTTGSSLRECAHCLLSAGAEEVLCATLARSPV